MYLSIDTIKEQIYDRILEIEDENILMAIKTLIDNINVSHEENKTDKMDLTGYIKELVKNI